MAAQNVLYQAAFAVMMLAVIANVSGGVANGDITLVEYNLLVDAVSHGKPWNDEQIAGLPRLINLNRIDYLMDTIARLKDMREEAQAAEKEKKEHAMVVEKEKQERKENEKKEMDMKLAMEEVQEIKELVIEAEKKRKELAMLAEKEIKERAAKKEKLKLKCISSSSNMSKQPGLISWYSDNRPIQYWYAPHLEKKPNGFTIPISRPPPGTLNTKDVYDFSFGQHYSTPLEFYSAGPGTLKHDLQKITVQYATRNRTSIGHPIFNFLRNEDGSVKIFDIVNGRVKFGIQEEPIKTTSHIRLYPQDWVGDHPIIHNFFFMGCPLEIYD